MKRWKLILFIMGVIIMSSQVLADDVGHEFIDAETLHFWNNNSLDTGHDYYLNYTSFMQFTNHYEQYWSKNTFCGKFKRSVGNWNEFCFDKLTLNRKQILSDNLTFINITGAYTGDFLGGNATFILQYHLKVNDSDLTVIPNVEVYNILLVGVETAFEWKISEINISYNPQNDIIAVNKTLYYLNNTRNEFFNNVEIPLIVLQDKNDSQFLRIRWDQTLNYSIETKSVRGQYNAPINLTINYPSRLGDFNTRTEFLWLDGFTICGDGASAVSSITMSAPPASPQNTETSFPVGCTVLTDTGLGFCTDFIQHQRSTGTAYQDVPTNYTAIANARSQGKTLDNNGDGLNGVEDTFTVDCGLRHTATNTHLVLSCQASTFRDNGNVTCVDNVIVSYPYSINLNQKNFTNINNRTMTIDCNGQDQTNINDIQVFTNISATGNNMVLNQTLNLFGTGASLVYNTTRTFTLSNVPNGIYKYSCLVNDTANNRFMSQNYTYTINFIPPVQIGKGGFKYDNPNLPHVKQAIRSSNITFSFDT